MRAILVLALLAAAGCAEVVSETRGTYTEFGRTYPSVTRVYQNDDGSTYSRTTIISGAERVTCITDDRLDCRAALFDTVNRVRD
ncbi:hypothetical protein [uncultured Tateyamaria sp.]|uniref:hypothetical protein n=1 Tax=uncultured Tateyamaria sp. TaxID=455651 RepID=UPI00260FEB74|nr:hypothetical protein [uncultured Tateyamaria sp.]